MFETVAIKIRTFRGFVVIFLLHAIFTVNFTTPLPRDASSAIVGQPVNPGISPGKDGNTSDVIVGQPENPRISPGKDGNISFTTRRCVLNFFGLPRGFKHLVLPSVEANVILPNVQYDCDYFVHFYNATYEPPSRSGSGGPIMPEDVYLLREAVHNIAHQAGRPQRPHVGIIHHSDADFQQNQSVLLERIRRNDTETEKNPFVYHGGHFSVETHVNVIKAWHSISAVWEAMKEHASSHAIKYERVAMMRIDVMYITPIDIFRSAPERHFDEFNNKSVIPAFAKYPVNDRMFYGPYEAAEIWASGRFSRLDHYVYELHEPLHPESFLASQIVPAIEELGIAVGEDAQICFLRARADESVWEDCPVSQIENVVQELATVNCSTPTSYRWTKVPAEDCRVLYLC